MLTAEGCRRRRERLWAKFDPPLDTDYVLLSDPIHLVYFANYWADPISLGAGFPAYLLIRNDGHAKLLHENRAPKSALLAHANETRSIVIIDVGARSAVVTTRESKRRCEASSIGIVCRIVASSVHVIGS